MKDFICGLYDGTYNTGCVLAIGKNCIVVQLLFSTLLELRSNQVVKLIQFKNSWTQVKLEYNVGTKKNEIVDLSLSVFRKKAFMRYAEELGYTTETRERFKREYHGGELR